MKRSASNQFLEERSNPVSVEACELLTHLESKDAVTVQEGLRLLSLVDFSTVDLTTIKGQLLYGLSELVGAQRRGTLQVRPGKRSDAFIVELQRNGMSRARAEKVVEHGPLLLSDLAAWNDTVAELAPPQAVQRTYRARRIKSSSRWTAFTVAHRALFAASDDTLMSWSKDKGYPWATVRMLLTGDISGKSGISRSILEDLIAQYGADQVEKVLDVARKTEAIAKPRYRQKAQSRVRPDLQEKLDRVRLTQAGFARRLGVKTANVGALIHGRNIGAYGNSKILLEALESLPVDTVLGKPDPADDFFREHGTTLDAWRTKHNITERIARKAFSEGDMACRSWRQLRCRMLLISEFGLSDNTGGLADTVYGVLAMENLCPKVIATEMGVSRQAVDFLLKGNITLESPLAAATVAMVAKKCRISEEAACESIRKAVSYWARQPGTSRAAVAGDQLDPQERFFQEQGTTLAAWAAQHRLSRSDVHRIVGEVLQNKPLGRRSWHQLLCRMMLSRDFGLPDSTGGLADSAYGLLAIRKQNITSLQKASGLSRELVQSVISGQYHPKAAVLEQVASALARLCDIDAEKALELLNSGFTKPTREEHDCFFRNGTTQADWAERHDLDRVVVSQIVNGAPLRNLSYQKLRCRILLSRELGFPDTTEGYADTVYGVLAMARHPLSALIRKSCLSIYTVKSIIKGSIALETAPGRKAVRALASLCGITADEARAVFQRTVARSGALQAELQKDCQEQVGLDTDLPVMS